MEQAGVESRRLGFVVGGVAVCGEVSEVWGALYALGTVQGESLDVGDVPNRNGSVLRRERVKEGDGDQEIREDRRTGNIEDCGGGKILSSSFVA